jgi:hypothetical protein
VKVAPSVGLILSAEHAEDVVQYASALDEIGGKRNPNLAELLLEDDEHPTARKALRALAGPKRDEANWLLGWFRGAADVMGREPLELLRAGRAQGPKLEED